jgi:hypothetical protein
MICFEVLDELDDELVDLEVLKICFEVEDDEVRVLHLIWKIYFEICDDSKIQGRHIGLPLQSQLA